MAGLMPLFRQIHRLRMHLHNLKEQLDRIPRQRKARQERLTKQEQALRDTQESIRKLKVSGSDKEKSLKAKHGQIAKYEEQINLIASKKEYDALQLEIAHAKTVCGQLEDEILQAMTDVDEKSALVPELEKTLAQIAADFAKFEEESKARKADLEAQASQAQKDLQEAEAQIPDDLRPQYNRTISSLKHDGLAAVNGRSCAGCYTEMISEARENLEAERFVVCNSCGRILYLPETTKRLRDEDE